MNRTLVLSPHTDDGELGAGATISKLKREGNKIIYIAFCAPGSGLSAECQLATKSLGIDETRILDFKNQYFPSHRQEVVQTLYDLNKEIDPDLVLTPCTADRHQDHETMTNEATRIFKTSTMLGYILPWNTLDVTENCVIDVSEQDVENKLGALDYYKSQVNRHYFDSTYQKSQMRANGVKIYSKYAEIFEVIRYIA